MGIIYKNGIPYGNQRVLDATLTQQGEAADAKAAGDAVSELRNTLNHKADVIYDTVSGDIASFPDGADGLPVKDLTVSIEPVQSGTGDPSPTNVRPISGWTGMNITKTNGNLLRLTSDNVGHNWDGQVNAKRCWWSMKVPNGSYTVSMDSSSTFSETKCGVSKLPYPLTPAQWDTHPLSQWNDLHTNNYKRTVTVNDEYPYIIIGFISSGDSISIQDFVNSKVQINYGTEQLAYSEPLQTTIPISWQSSAGTVYAASLDALAGSLKVRPYYASYNGETLVGPWISSMDAYTPGGTPTTGAQVVDFGGSETSYSLDAIALNTLLGQNNIWADCGPSTVEYPADTKLYIDKKLAALVAALS